MKPLIVLRSPNDYLETLDLMQEFDQSLTVSRFSADFDHVDFRPPFGSSYGNGEEILHSAIGRFDVILIDLWRGFLKTDPPPYFANVTLNQMTRFWRFPSPSVHNLVMAPYRMRQQFTSTLRDIAANPAVEIA